MPESSPPGAAYTIPLASTIHSVRDHLLARPNINAWVYGPMARSGRPRYHAAGGRARLATTTLEDRSMKLTVIGCTLLLASTILFGFRAVAAAVLNVGSANI